MTRHAAADNRAGEHVERREQRGGAVTLVIVGHRAGPALLHRQPGWVRSSAWIWLISGDQGQHRLQAKSELTKSLQSGTPCKADLLVAINSYPAGLHGAETKIPHSRGWRGPGERDPSFLGRPHRGPAKSRSHVHPGSVGTGLSAWPWWVKRRPVPVGRLGE